MRLDRYPECPGDDLLRDLAAGLCAPETKTGLLQHSAQCDHCGPMLAGYLEEFSEEHSPEVEAALASSRSARPEWQRRTVRELLREQRPVKPGFWSYMPALINSWPRAAGWAAATALLASAILGVPPLKATLELKKAQSLVAAASEKKRTIAMRLTGVPHGDYQPPVRTLGPGPQRNDSPDLIEAESKVVRKELDLKSGEKLDPRWQQVKGRIELLKSSGDSQAAEKVLEDALAANPDDASVAIDLAASYFQSDTHSDASPNYSGSAPHPPENSPRNLSRTIDLLNRVLKDSKVTREQRSVALFDLAIAYQESNMLDLAVATWKEYLNDSDPSSPWDKEARERLQQAQARMPRPISRDFRAPLYFAQHSSDRDLANDIEQYQDFAFAAWIAPASNDPEGAPALALHSMAGLMEQQHSDTWWRDFLRATTKADLPAVSAFTKAYLADRNDLHYQSLDDSRRAARLFGQHRNLPGELMARFQEVYALQRIPSGADCLAHASRLWTRLINTDYRWLQGQVALERATCANLVSDFQASQAYLEAGRQVASQYNFPELRLRAIGLEASMLRLQKKHDPAWREAVAGLEEYWQDSYSYERLYQFYAVMRQCAQDYRAVYAAEALLRHSIELLPAEDTILQAVLQLQLANLFLEQGDTKAADREANAARTLLERIPDDPSAQTYSTFARLRLVGFDLRRGQASEAVLVLKRVQEHLPPRDDFVRLDYYAALGNAWLQLGRWDAAVDAFEQGIQVAAGSLKHFPDDSSRLPWIRATGEIYRGLVQAFLAQGKDERALAAWERSKSQAFEKGSQGPPSTIVISGDRTGEARLVYAIFADRLHVWTVNGGRVNSRSVAIKEADLRRRVRDFVQSSSTPDQTLAQFESQSQDLYTLFLAPVAAFFEPAQTVIIELDETIPALALESLRSPAGRYFGEEYAVVYSPGMRAERTLRPPRPFRPRDRFLAVDVSAHDGSGHLPGHELATQAVLKFHPNTRLITAADAKPQTVLRELAGSAAFQFFGHGRRDGTGMALDLGNGSLLSSRDLSHARLERMQMTVLAACSSGSAENGLLDSGSLVRTFLSGGVPLVIASHWYVDSESTAELIQSFYRHLATEPPPQALRDARREMRLAKPHPYYWAAISLTGRSI